MYPANQECCETLDQLAALVAKPGDRRVLRAEGYMDLHVSRGGSNLLVLAHYFTQNGDLMSDPRMTFWHGPDHRWYPVDYELHALGIRQEAILEWSASDAPLRFAPRTQRDLARFTATWCRNLREQGFLEATSAAEAS